MYSQKKVGIQFKDNEILFPGSHYLGLQQPEMDLGAG